MTYENVNGFIIILADDRDPDVSWAHHRERGSAGGVDCVAPIGTPIYAPDDCVVANVPDNGTGGNTITISYADGWRDQMMHLSEFVDPGFKRKLELIGYSGDTASPGQPHVHWHRIDPAGYYADAWGGTSRRNPFHYFGAAPAAVDTAPIPAELQEFIMGNRISIVNPTDPGDDALYALSDAGHWIKLPSTKVKRIVEDVQRGNVIDYATKGEIGIARDVLRALNA